MVTNCIFVAITPAQEHGTAQEYFMVPDCQIFLPSIQEPTQLGP
jgi:hypothetical protein